MMHDTRISLLDVVALLVDKPDKGLVAGHVGTVVEVGPANTLLVEFINPEGQTFALRELKHDELLVLKHEPVAAL